jgi:hypothetical protein
VSPYSQKISLYSIDPVMFFIDVFINALEYFNVSFASFIML